MKHTPGPWRQSGTISIYANGDKFSRAPNRVASIDEQYEISERAANAYLISAAPDMLEALIAAEGHLKETLADPKWHPIRDCPVLRVVQAAIKKARGEL